MVNESSEIFLGDRSKWCGDHELFDFQMKAQLTHTQILRVKRHRAILIQFLRSPIQCMFRATIVILRQTYDMRRI